MINSFKHVLLLLDVPPYWHITQSALKFSILKSKLIFFPHSVHFWGTFNQTSSSFLSAGVQMREGQIMLGLVDVVVVRGVSIASFTVLLLSMNSCRFE
jgi:hypothetical protein